MDDELAVVLVGPWLKRMTEEQFLTWLMDRLKAKPPRTVTIPLVDLCIDIVLPEQELARLTVKHPPPEVTIDGVAVVPRMESLTIQQWPSNQGGD